MPEDKPQMSLLQKRIEDLKEIIKLSNDSNAMTRQNGHYQAANALPSLVDILISASKMHDDLDKLEAPVSARATMKEFRDATDRLISKSSCRLND